MDSKLFILIYTWARSEHKFFEIFKLITKLSSKIFFALFIVFLVYVFMFQNKKLFLYLIIPLMILCFNLSFRKIIGRERPFCNENIKSKVKFDKKIINNKLSNSMPSNHSASSMAISMAIFYVNPLIGIVAIIIACITGFSRICVGVHYPFDVVVGLSWSFFFCYFMYFIA